MNNQEKNSNLTAMSDEEIVSLYWDRDEKAIDITDRKYGRHLYTIAYNILRDHPDSEECLNDTYLGAWNSIPPNRPTAFFAFLSKITRNTAIRKFRHASASKRIPSELTVSLDELDDCLPFEASEEEKYLVRRLAEILNSYLRSLSDRQVFIFVCRYYYYDTVASIAKMLGLSENTILRDLAKIRKGLKEYLDKEGYSYE